MLKKINRLDRKDIEKIFSSGIFVGSSGISLRHLLDKKNGGRRKVSFVVPKSISRKAVVRNFLRRRGYRSIENFMNSLPGGFLGMFIFGKKSVDSFGAKGKNKDISLKNLRLEIENLLKRVR